MSIQPSSEITLFRLGTASVRDHRGTPPPFASNLTASYVPEIFVPKDQLKSSVDATWRLPEVDLDLIRALAADLENHFERRLQLMLQQFLLVYQTGVICFSGKTDGQMGQGNEDYAAAHNATLPTLFCKKGQQELFLAKDSSLGDTWNETVLLPKLANQLDSRLDLHHRKMGVAKALRALAVEQLNAVADARGAVTPEQGLHNFVDQTGLVLDSAIRKTQNEQELLILRAYLKANREYAKLLQRPSVLVRKLCLIRDEVELTQEFYKSFQHSMYRELILPKEAPAIVVRVNPVIRPARTPALTGRALVYVKSCLKDAEVQKCLRACREQLDADAKLRDEMGLGLLTSAHLAQDLPFSPFLRALHEASLALIRKKHFVQEPKNVGLILQSMLQQSAAPQEPLAIVASIEPVIRPPSRPALSGRALVYAKSCLADAEIQKCLQVYKEQVDAQSKRRDQTGLDLLNSSDSVKNLPFSPFLKALHAACLARILEKYSVREPKNMGLILKDLLFETDLKK